MEQIAMRTLYTTVLAGLLLQLSGCIVLPTSVTPEITRIDDVEIIGQVSLTVGPRRLIDEVSESIVKHGPEIQLVDPLAFRDAAFPEGGWALKELLQPGRPAKLAQDMDVQYLVLLAPECAARGKTKGLFIPLVVGAVSETVDSSLNALIMDLERETIVCRLKSAASGTGYMASYVIYMVATEPKTAEAAIDGLGKSIAETLSTVSPSKAPRIAVLAAEGSSEPFRERIEQQKQETQ
jgi:hypothetical protein